MSDIKTELLNEKLLKSSNIKDFIRSNEKHIRVDSFNNYLYDLLQDSGLKNTELFARAGMSESYGYQLLNGKRQPSRDKAIQLSFGFPLSIEQTNTLLKLSGKNELYVKNIRDAIILFALNNKFSLIAVNELLDDEGFEILE